MAATLSEVETRLADLKVIQDPQPPEERTSAMNRFRDGVCLCTPFGYHVHYFTDLNFCLCPHDAPLASGAYNPRACAHWLVSEGFELLFEPGWQQLEIPEL
jgi:hypothetical protein